MIINVENFDSFISGMSTRDMRELHFALEQRMKKLAEIAEKFPIKENEDKITYCRRVRNHGVSLCDAKNSYELVKE